MSPAWHQAGCCCKGKREGPCQYCTTITNTWSVLFSGVVVPTSCSCDPSPPTVVSYTCGKWTSLLSVDPNDTFELTRTDANPCIWEYIENATGTFQVYNKPYSPPYCEVDDLIREWSATSIRVEVKVDSGDTRCKFFCSVDRVGASGSTILQLFEGIDPIKDCTGVVVDNIYTTLQFPWVAGHGGTATCTPNV